MNAMIGYIREVSITMKTYCPDLRSAYRELIVQHYHRLWDARCEKKRARESMTVYAGKQKVLDSFLRHALYEDVNRHRSVHNCMPCCKLNKKKCRKSRRLAPHLLRHLITHLP